MVDKCLRDQSDSLRRRRRQCVSLPWLQPASSVEVTAVRGKQWQEWQDADVLHANYNLTFE